MANTFPVGRVLVAAALVVALAGCTIPVVADPETFSVRVDTAKLRTPQAIELKNGYASETKAIILVPPAGVGGWQADLQQLTNAAMQMMSRHLVKNGISVGPGEKTVVLRVRDVSAREMFLLAANVTTTSLSLEAQLGDGVTASISTRNDSPVSKERSIEGALLFAVTSLLNHADFVAYANR